MESNHIIIKEGRKTYEINPETGMKVLVKPAQKYTEKGRLKFGLCRKTNKVTLQTGRG